MSKVTAHQSKLVRFKHKKATMVALIVIAIVIVLPVTALAYVGFVPGVSEMMRTNKPDDLGVRYNAADFTQLTDTNAFGVTVGNYDKTAGLSEDVASTPPGSKLVVYGARTNEAALTQEELTAFINMTPWANSPLSNSQIRLSNGVVEFSGNVKSRYVANVIQSVYPAGNYGQASPFIKLASRLHNPAVYAKMTVSVDNQANEPSHGRLHLKIVALKVNRMDLTSNVSNQSAIDMNVGEAGWAHDIGFSLGSLTATTGKLNVYGTIPTGFAVGDGDSSVVCKNYHGGSLLTLSPVAGRLGSTVTYCQ